MKFTPVLDHQFMQKETIKPMLNLDDPVVFKKIQFICDFTALLQQYKMQVEGLQFLDRVNDFQYGVVTNQPRKADIYISLDNLMKNVRLSRSQAYFVYYNIVVFEKQQKVRYNHYRVRHEVVVSDKLLTRHTTDSEMNSYFIMLRYLERVIKPDAAVLKDFHARLLFILNDQKEKKLTAAQPAPVPFTAHKRQPRSK